MKTKKFDGAAHESSDYLMEPPTLRSLRRNFLVKVNKITYIFIDFPPA